MRHEKRVSPSVIKRLAPYLSGRKAELIWLLSIMLLSNLLALLSPLLSGRAVDAIGIAAGKVDFRGVFINCGLMLFCYAVSSVLSYLLSVRLLRLSQDVAFSLRRDVFQKLTQLPVAYFDTHPAGDIISRVCYDIDTIHASLSTDLLQVLTSVITVLGSLIMLLIISPKLSLVFAVTVPLSMLISRFLMKRVHPLFAERSRKLGELNSSVEESVSGIRTVRAYGREKQLLRLFDGKNDAAIEAYYRADRASCALGPSVNLINNLSLSAISVFGALLYLGGSLTLGSVSSFVLYSRKFSGPIRETANIIAEVQAAFAAAERVFHLIDEEPEPPDRATALPLPRVEGNVSLSDVSFSYVPGRPTLSDISVDVPAGAVVAVVGPTGAGKTTIVNLLMRFYDVCGGSVRVDGVDIRDLLRADVRRSYAMVLQDTWLFSGSIYENVSYGSPGATRERVIEACRAAKIHDFIEALPDGYDTVLADDGTSVSKGQKQLLTIARAMLLDAGMLILDEATSNVDTNTELAINVAMAELMRGRTCFVIAHRLSTIEHADRILVIDRGRLVEQGTHTELLEKRGVYREMYAAQFYIA